MAAMSATARRGVGSAGLAWSLAALVVVLQVGAGIYAVVARSEPLEVDDFILPTLALAFVTVGVLVASRQPCNAIGWTFLGAALSVGVGGVAHTFVSEQVGGGRGDDTMVGVAAAFSDISWVPFVLVPATMLLLLFPDGRLPSRAWRPVARVAIAGIVVTFFHGLANPNPLADFPTVSNPLAIESPVMDGVEGLGFILAIAGIIGAAASLAARRRGAGQLERLQIKWLTAAGAIVAVTFPTMLALYEVLPQGAADAGIMLSLLGLPVAAGIAMLRYRLYDVDVVINHTLVYGALTGLLAGAYLGSVLLLQLVLSPSSDLAIAASTLAVAALFGPLRARIQALVDRRFFRRKYDAQHTLAAFGARLRDEVSLDALNAELRGVIADTVQPAHLSLWMRPR